jgi:hypothetical protein
VKAKCPYCKNGCEKCDGGYNKASMATGKIYTRHCNDCGEDNGGRIAAAFVLPPHQWNPPDPCVWCHSPNVEWLLVGEVIKRVLPRCHICARESNDAVVTTLICADCGEPACLSHSDDHKFCEDPKNESVQRAVSEDPT